MQNFNWTCFTHRIAIKASIHDIYNAWTISNELEKWFLKTASFFDDKQIERDKSSGVERGYTYKWIWYLYKEVETGHVVNVNGKDYISFTFAGECLVEVKLKEDGEYTLVELTQGNIPVDDHSKQSIRLDCSKGWAFYLVNLKSVYEGGLDLRNKDPRLTPMINN